MLVVDWNLSWDCQPEQQHADSPYCLGFLTTWQPLSSWSSYMAAQGSRGEYLKRIRHKAFVNEPWKLCAISDAFCRLQSSH